MCGAPVRDKSGKLLWVSVVSGVLAFLAIIMRSTVAFLSENWRWDDACAITAWIFSTPLTVLQLITPGLGLGRDTWTVATENIIKVLQVSQELVLIECQLSYPDDLCVASWLLHNDWFHQIHLLILLPIHIPNQRRAHDSVYTHGYNCMPLFGVRTGSDIFLSAGQCRLDRLDEGGAF